MSDRLIPLGIRCRQHRSRLGLVMADQAKGLRYSVSTISAIERGARPIPEGYLSEVARWLKLSPSETQELEELGNGERTVIQFFPADNERAQLAFDFARTLNDLPLDQIRQLRKRLTSSPPSSHSPQELRQMARLVRDCFDLGNKLAFDLLDILENKLPLIDPDYSLQVEPTHALGDRVAAYSESVRNLAQRIVFTEHSYESLSKQTPEARVVGAHELAHWLAHSKAHTFSNARRAIYQRAEIDADRLAIEILLPEEIVEKFETAGQLAMTCNVPLKIARLRMKELSLGSFRQERERVGVKFSELLAQLKETSDNSDSKSATVVSLPTENSQKYAQSVREKNLSNEPLDAKNMLVALGSYSGHHQPFYDKIGDARQPTTSSFNVRSSGAPSVTWFKHFGWR